LVICVVEQLTLSLYNGVMKAEYKRGRPVKNKASGDAEHSQNTDAEENAALHIEGGLPSNENKMSDGGRGRASLGMEGWKSSQKWSAQRSAVRSIAWLDDNGGNINSPLHEWKR
jgi:hypothetical protein